VQLATITRSAKQAVNSSMVHLKTTLRLLQIVTWWACSSVTFVDAAVCVLNANGFVGRDSGNTVNVAFEYNLTVTSTVDLPTIEDTILPSLENAFARRTARRLLAECASPGTSTSASSKNIVGIHVLPTDYVVGRCDATISSCFVIHGETTIYVVSTAVGVEASYRRALAELFQGNSFAVVNSNILNMTSFRAAKPDSPTSGSLISGDEKSGTSPDEVFAFFTSTTFHYALIGIVIGIAACVLFCLYKCICG